MDRLALHIEYLLLRHDCVVVPGCGAFINVYHSALEHPDSGVISPMTNEVRFNPALTHDDGMLSNSYSRRERVSYAEGREMVRTSVSNLRDALSLDGEVAIGRLGNLQMDAEQNISFHPVSTPQRTAAAAGFTDVRFRSIRTKVVHEPAETTEREPEKKQQRIFNTDRNYYIPVNKMFARMAASFIIIAAVALAVLAPFGRELHEDQASVIPVKAIAQAVAKNSVPDQDPLPAPAPEFTVDTISPKWHLIVATFHSQKEADEFIRMNSNRGYSLSTVASRNLYRVSAHSTIEKAPLLTELNSPDFQSIFPQAWIFNSAN